MEDVFFLLEVYIEYGENKLLNLGFWLNLNGQGEPSPMVL